MPDKGTAIISFYVAENGPVVTIKYHNQYIICIIKGTGMESDQNVSTSKYYAMN